MAADDTLRFTYRNWRGVVAERHVRPTRIYFGTTPWHPQKQWLMGAWDLDKGALRTFALLDIIGAHNTDAGGDRFLIWSGVHLAFRRADGCGYTNFTEQAAKYSRRRADDICSSAGQGHEGLPREVPVREQAADLIGAVLA